jgi:hypothetical protein
MKRIKCPKSYTQSKADKEIQQLLSATFPA